MEDLLPFVRDIRAQCMPARPHRRQRAEHLDLHATAVGVLDYDVDLASKLAAHIGVNALAAEQSRYEPELEDVESETGQHIDAPKPVAV